LDGLVFAFGLWVFYPRVARKSVFLPFDSRLVVWESLLALWYESICELLVRSTLSNLGFLFDSFAATVLLGFKTLERSASVIISTRLGLSS